MVFKESSNLTGKNEFENRRVEKAIGIILNEITADRDCLVPPKEVNEEISSPFLVEEFTVGYSYQPDQNEIRAFLGINTSKGVLTYKETAEDLRLIASLIEGQISTPSNPYTVQILRDPETNQVYLKIVRHPE